MVGLSSVRRQVDLLGSGDDGDLLVRERRRLRLTDLFDDEGRFVVHGDPSDEWEGYVRCEDDAGVYYLHHDDRRDQDAGGYGVDIRVGEEAVRLAARSLIEEGRLDVATLGGESA